jgi:small subunit ribosomal protein S21
MAYKKSKHRNQRPKGYARRRDEERTVRVKGKRPSHVSVYPRKGENPERAIKRFLKKCKKMKIVEEYRKREYFEKPSTKRRRMKMRRLALIKKEAAKNKE